MRLPFCVGIDTTATGLITLLLVSCSTHVEKSDQSVVPPAKSSSQAAHRLGATPVSGERPHCLSIQEGDRHVEFNGVDLFLAEEGQPVRLALNNGDDVICESLEIVRNADQPSVLIRFRTYEVGTSIGISDTKIAIASIRTAKWILSPLIVERRLRTGEQIEVDERARYRWADDKSHPALIVTDTLENTSKVIKP